MIRKISRREAPEVPWGSNYVWQTAFTLPGMTLDDLETMLLNETFLESIPYHSRYNGTTTRLYNRVDFRPVDTEFYMRPFEPFTGMIEAVKEGNTLSWRFRNTSPIKYKWFPVVGRGKMYTRLTALESPTGLKLEGVASVGAFTFFGIFGRRIDWAVEGRITALFYAVLRIYVMAEDL